VSKDGACVRSTALPKSGRPGAEIGEQYGNIEGSKWSQTGPDKPTRQLLYAAEERHLALIPNHFGLSISGPEKAGVGGSIADHARPTAD
jgi:hypothetical protein